AEPVEAARLPDRATVGLDEVEAGLQGAVPLFHLAERDREAVLRLVAALCGDGALLEEALVDRAGGRIALLIVEAIRIGQRRVRLLRGEGADGEGDAEQDERGGALGYGLSRLHRCLRETDRADHWTRGDAVELQQG